MQAQLSSHPPATAHLDLLLSLIRPVHLQVHLHTQRQPEQLQSSQPALTAAAAAAQKRLCQVRQ
jgi:hypothetical protein